MQTRATWIAQSRRTELTSVDVQLLATGAMIYRDLGVYTGLKLRKPCDEL